MEEDFQNYLPTVMFRGTPCTLQNKLVIMSSYLQYEDRKPFDVILINILWFEDSDQGKLLKNIFSRYLYKLEH